MTGESKVLEKLRGVTAKLTANEELRKDLLQEMLIHLVDVEVKQPGRTVSWYIKSCEYRARNYLKHGRSVDSLKRAGDLVPLGLCSDEAAGHMFFQTDAVDPTDGHAELAAREIVELVMPRLSSIQQEILYLLMKGLGVREVARELGVSHPAVIKHRRKIAGLVDPLLNDPVLAVYQNSRN